MKLIEGIAALLPGDIDLGYIAFSKIMYMELKKNSELISWVENKYEIFINMEDLRVSSIDLMIKFLQSLKKDDSKKFQEFRFNFLEIYFKSPEHKSHSSRPPNDSENVIIFDEIEFDLLEPVLDRGPIWRVVDNERD